MPARNHSSEDVALSLTLAVVTSSPSPLVLLDGQLNVIAASTSFCDVFGVDMADLTGHPLYTLDGGEWDSPELRSLMTATMSGERAPSARDIDLNRPRRPVRHLIIQTRWLTYLDLDQTRILLAVSDVTDARAHATSKESALQENSVLLQEVRHRVANSLQIIASVLLQNARKTTSDETRGHLKDAHHRVMSVAALERMLSTSEDGDIEVQAYFTSLCENGPNWILCVRDDGVGMPITAPLRTGLGTSIVRALAGQLNASVEVTSQRPGTQVSIKHTQIALVQDDPETASERLAMADDLAASTDRRMEERS